jgi:hypothetical protein
MPFFEFEAVYEQEHLPAGNTVNMRKQHWWLVTSGNINGHFYGHADIYQFSPGWKNTLQQAEFRNQLIHMRTLFDAIAWWKLIPDTDNDLVLVGNKGSKATRVTASLAEDGSLALLYTPGDIDPTVDMSTFSDRVTARWYNPTNGRYEAPMGPYKNRGRRTFARPDDRDWVLVVQVESREALPLEWESGK